MWYPPQNNIVLHSPHTHSVCIVRISLKRTTSDRVLSLFFFFHRCTVCVWTYVRMYVSYWCAVCMYIIIFFSVFVCVSLLYAQTWICFTYILNSPKYTNRFKPLFRYSTSYSIRFFLVYKFIIVRLQLKFYIFLNEIIQIKPFFSRSQVVHSKKEILLKSKWVKTRNCLSPAPPNQNGFYIK